MLSTFQARGVLSDAHLSWSEGDVEGTIACYNDDLRYVCDTGGYDGGPLVIVGKQQFRDFLRPIQQTLASSSAVKHFVMAGESGLAFVDCTLDHQITGKRLVGTYTQVVRYRAGRISQLYEIHDVARMADFWRLLLSHDDEPAAEIFKSREDNSTRWQNQLPRNWHFKRER